jgi:hypothetical protein
MNVEALASCNEFNNEMMLRIREFHNEIIALNAHENSCLCSFIKITFNSRLWKSQTFFFRRNKRLAISLPAPCVYYVLGFLPRHSFYVSTFSSSSTQPSGKHNEQRESFKWIFIDSKDWFMFLCFRATTTKWVWKKYKVVLKLSANR